MPDLHSTKIYGNLNVTGDTTGVKSITDSKTNSEVKIWTGTAAEYSAITTKDPNIIYYVTA